MTRWVRLVCALVILVSVAACSRTRPPSVEALPTRTPRPTFTTAPDLSASPWALFVTPSDTPSEAGTPDVTAVSLPTATQQPQGTTGAKPTGTPSSAAAAQPSSTPNSADTPEPTDVTNPTPTPGQTGIPLPSPTVFACGSGYEMYRNDEMGFAACPPAGWTLSDHDDAEHSTKWSNFSPPTSNAQTGEGFQILSVGESPNPAGSDEEAAVKQAALRLIREYGGSLKGWPYSITVDGRKSVEAHYTGLVVFETGVVELTGWEAVLVVGDRQWTIAAIARSELSAEMEEVHKQFLSHFQILSR